VTRGSLFDEGQYNLIVSVRGKNFTRKLWPEWGGGQRVNFYTDALGRLLVVGVGGESVVSILEKDSPKEINFYDKPISNEYIANLKFIGTIDAKMVGTEYKLVFIAPYDAAECNIRFGYTSMLTKALSSRTALPCN
jgi:hypothetical protein